MLLIPADLTRDAAADEARSALPDAPVVVPAPAPTPRTHRRTHWARLRLSDALLRAADRVAPAECSPAR